MSTIFQGAANLMGSLGVKVCVPEMVREMQNPRDYAKAWGYAQLFVVPLYIGIGLWGYALFGTFANVTSLFNNFKNVGVLSGYFIFQPIAMMMPVCYGQILLFLKAELHWGVLPCDWWTVSNPGTNRFPSIPPVLFRLGFRCGVLAIWVFLALLAIGFPTAIVFSLFSAISSGAFSFWLPYICSLLCFGHQFGTLKKVVYMLAIVVSLFFTGIGVWSSSLALANLNTAKPFAFASTCTSVAGFFVGQFDSSNYHSSGGAYSTATGPGTWHDTFYLGTCSAQGRTCCAQPAFGCDGGSCKWNADESQVICTGVCNVSSNVTII